MDLFLSVCEKKLVTADLLLFPWQRPCLGNKNFVSHAGKPAACETQTLCFRDTTQPVI